jgi:hypothetical protein
MLSGIFLIYIQYKYKLRTAFLPLFHKIGESGTKKLAFRKGQTPKSVFSGTFRKGQA